MIAGGPGDSPRREASARLRVVRDDQDVEQRDPATARDALQRSAIARDEVRRVEHDDMPLHQQLIHQRLHQCEDRTILLGGVRRRDEEPAAQVVGRHVCPADLGDEKARAVRLPHSREAHEHDERRMTVRPGGHADLATQLRDERAAVLGQRARLRDRRVTRATRGSRLSPHAAKPSSRSASRAAAASSQGLFSSPTMIEPSCPLPARSTVSPACARRIASRTASRRSSMTA